jgi:hypothetical protein
MTRYRVLAWDGIPAQVKAFPDQGDPHSVLLDAWFSEHIDRVAMERGLFGSDAYLELWDWTADAERDGSAQDVAAAVKAELEAEWAPRRAAWEQGAAADEI